MNTSALFPLLLVLLAGCSAAPEITGEPDEPAPEATAEERAPKRSRNDEKNSPASTSDADTPAAGKKACGTARNGVQARALPGGQWLKRSDKLIVTPTRVITMSRGSSGEAQSISKTTSDHYTYFYNDVDDIAVMGSDVYILSFGRVHKAPVTGDETEVAWYGAVGGVTIVADATDLYVGASLGADSPLYRGAPTYDTNLFGAEPPPTWVTGPSFVALSQTAHTIYAMTYFRDNGTTVRGVSAIDKDTSAVTYLFQTEAAVREFWSDDTQTIFTSKDGVHSVPVGTLDGADLALADDPKGLSVTADYVYFAEKGTLRRVRRDGSAPAEDLFEGDCTISALTMSDDGLYFATDEAGRGRMFVLPRP